MTEELSDETVVLLEAADRAIASSKEIVEQRRQMMAECRKANRQQQLRFALRRQPLTSAPASR
jgi:hypothetical protein